MTVTRYAAPPDNNARWDDLQSSYAKINGAFFIIVYPKKSVIQFTNPFDIFNEIIEICVLIGESTFNHFTYFR